MKPSREEFIRLAVEQLDAVDRVARSLTRNAAEAEDLVQETYLNALKAHESFDLQSYGIRPWLLRILHNLHINRAKRERRQPAAIEDEQLQAVPDTSSPLHLDGSAEMDEHLRHAMDQLPADLGTALMLWAVDELSYKEIADVMGVPLGTVMSRLHRARRRLAELLEPSGGRRRCGAF